MKAATSFTCAAVKANGGIPFSGRPFCTTGMMSSPSLSFSTSCERSRLGPVSPPRASEPWQKAQATP